MILLSSSWQLCGFEAVYVLAHQGFVCMFFSCAPVCVTVLACMLICMCVYVDVFACWQWKQWAQGWSFSSCLKTDISTALNIKACFHNIHCYHQALRIEYSAYIFRAVILCRPDQGIFFIPSGQALSISLCHRKHILSCIYSENLPTSPLGRSLHNMCGKTYYRCHHLFNK